MKPASEVTALVYDNGQFIELALKLAQTYKKVYYHVPAEAAFPKMNVGRIGEGLDEIETVDNVFSMPMFDEIDVFIFPDLYSGPLQEHLERLGKNVWGPRTGECLELNREGMKEICRRLDLPVGEYAVIPGIDALHEHLKSHENQYVKINRYRGTFESFESKSFRRIEPKLDEIEQILGAAFKNTTNFIVESELPDMVEFGTDFWTIDGKYPSKLISGLEIKDKGFVSVFTKFDDIPEPLTRWNRRMSPVFEIYGYRGFVSQETRIGKEMDPYMIDVCCRMPSPPGELYQEQYENLADIIWQGSQGIVVDPIMVSKYGAELIIHSQWAEHHEENIRIPDDIRQWVKLRNCTRTSDGLYHVIPQSVGLVEIGAVIGLGNTIEEAVKMALEVGDQLDEYGIEIPKDALDDAQKQIEKMDKLGLNLF